MTERLLRARDVAEILDVEVGTVLDYFERGELPGFRLGGRIGRPLRFRQSEIEAWIESCRAGTLCLDNRNAPATPKRPGADIGGSGSHAGRKLQPVRDD